MLGWCYNESKFDEQEIFPVFSKGNLALWICHARRNAYAPLPNFPLRGGGAVPKAGFCAAKDRALAGGGSAGCGINFARKIKKKNLLLCS